MVALHLNPTKQLYTGQIGSYWERGAVLVGENAKVELEEVEVAVSSEQQTFSTTLAL
jgi:hypothetical protein